MPSFVPSHPAISGQSPQRLRQCLGAVICITSASCLPVQADETLSAFDLSLEQLMSIQVSVASKHQESISQAPATVTAYSQAEMQRLGYFTLGELANITAGYNTFYTYGEQVFTTRGQKAGSFNNNKHLLLVDDIPVVHARAGKVATEYEMPLHFASSVEFLKGPASALYGTGAFYGVVSITPMTLSDTESKTSMWRALASNENSGMQFQGNTLQRNALGESLVALSYFSQQASAANVGIPAKPLQKLYDDQESIFLMAKQKIDTGPLNGLTLGALYFKKSGGLGEFWQGDFSHPANELTWTTFVPYLKYEHELSDTVHLKSFVRKNISSEQGTALNFDAASWTAYHGTGTPLTLYKSVIGSDEAQTEVFWKPTPTQDVVIGVDMDIKKCLDSGNPSLFEVNADPGPPLTGGTGSIVFGENISIRTQSLYGQWHALLNESMGTEITGGLRMDKTSRGGEQLSHSSPRVVLMQPMGTQQSLKLMYSTAIRSPGIKEYALNTESRSDLLAKGVTLSDLQPETFSTLELSWIYLNDSSMVRASFFTNKTENALDSTNKTGTNYFINNTGAITAKGFELEESSRLNNVMRLSSNYSYALAKDDSGAKAVDVPSTTASASLLLDDAVGGKHALIFKYVKDWRESGATTAPGGYTRVDYTLNFLLTPGIELNTELRNLADRRNWYPKDGVADVPMAGRSLWLGITVRH